MKFAFSLILVGLFLSCPFLIQKDPFPKPDGWLGDGELVFQVDTLMALNPSDSEFPQLSPTDIEDSGFVFRWVIYGNMSFLDEVFLYDPGSIYQELRQANNGSLRYSSVGWLKDTVIDFSIFPPGSLEYRTSFNQADLESQGFVVEKFRGRVNCRVLNITYGQSNYRQVPTMFNDYQHFVSEDGNIRTTTISRKSLVYSDHHLILEAYKENETRSWSMLKGWNVIKITKIYTDEIDNDGSLISRHLEVINETSELGDVWAVDYQDYWSEQ